MSPLLRARPPIVRAPFGIALLLAAGGLLFWGVRTFLVYGLGVGEAYRDSPPGAFIPFVVVCTLAGLFVAYRAGKLLERSGR